MYRFVNFDPIDGDVPGYPFFDLPNIAFDARELLEGFSKDEIIFIEVDLDSILARLREMFLDDESLNDAMDGSLSPDFVDSLSDWDVFSLAIDCGIFERNIHPESPTDSSSKYAAVFVLMFVSLCIEALTCPEDQLWKCEEGPIAARLIAASNEAVSAAMALGLAKSHHHVSQISIEMERDRHERLAELMQEKARLAANKRHQATNVAKDYVRAEWLKHAADYNFNKSDFARTYANLIRSKFRNVQGDPLDVTVKTITESWLSPSAGKPAG